MIKNKKILLFLPLFVFLSFLNVNASNKIPEEVNTGKDNFKSNLKIIDNDSDYSNDMFLKRAQQSNLLNLNNSEYSEKYSQGSYFDSSYTLYGGDLNISSFVYSFYNKLPYKFTGGHLYEFHWYIKVSKDMDVIESFKNVSTENVYLIDGTGKSVSTEKLGYYIYTHDSDTGGTLVDLCLQFILTDSNTSTLFFFIGDKPCDTNFFYCDTLNPFEDKILKYFDNLTNKNLILNYTGGSAFEVEEFTNSSGTVHGGGGITFDGERTDDWLLYDDLEKCDTADIVCHVRNIGTRFKQLLTRIANGFQSVIRAIKNVVSDILDGIVSIFNELFVPKDGFIDNLFGALKRFFSEKLGILFFPFDFIIDFLNRFNNITSPDNPVISIPNISIGSLGTIIHERSFSLNEYWNTPPYNILYNVYLAFVHCFIGFCLYKLARKKYNEIIGGDSN